MCRLLMLVVTLGCCGCMHRPLNEVGEDTKVSYRYPAGLPREQVVVKAGEPGRSVAAADISDNEILAYVRKLEQSTGSRVARYDVYDVYRTFGGASAQVRCLQFDYVFYDEQERVLAVVTRHGTC